MGYILNFGAPTLQIFLPLFVFFPEGVQVTFLTILVASLQRRYLRVRDLLSFKGQREFFLGSRESQGKFGPGWYPCPRSFENTFRIQTTLKINP